MRAASAQTAVEAARAPSAVTAYALLTSESNSGSHRPASSNSKLEVSAEILRVLKSMPCWNWAINTEIGGVQHPLAQFTATSWATTDPSAMPSTVTDESMVAWQAAAFPPESRTDPRASSAGADSYSLPPATNPFSALYPLEPPVLPSHAHLYPNIHAATAPDAWCAHVLRSFQPPDEDLRSTASVFDHGSDLGIYKHSFAASSSSSLSSHWVPEATTESNFTLGAHMEFPNECRRNPVFLHRRLFRRHLGYEFVFITVSEFVFIAVSVRPVSRCLLAVSETKARLKEAKTSLKSQTARSAAQQLVSLERDLGDAQHALAQAKAEVNVSVVSYAVQLCDRLCINQTHLVKFALPVRARRRWRAQQLLTARITPRISRTRVTVALPIAGTLRTPSSHPATCSTPVTQAPCPPASPPAPPPRAARPKRNLKPSAKG
ncbi:hypothetical protein GGX14DRAFT_581057 [Mycena pura]|uniref:Uncharacterized protein n=1 Tax=Mycena pura TaxID=153505 RepID=A0AAD6XYS5_9AGAR|nr:hypothetical protein GGX14DRAFT_581057 [Mycena pura]